MTNPTNPPAQRIEPDQRKNASKTISGADVQAVLLEIDKLVSDHDVRHFEDAGDEEKGVQYERVLSFRFPEDIQNEFNIRYIEVPVRKLLQWAAAELPDDAETINAIRDEYYGGDEPEDHEFGVPEWNFNNAPPTIEELSIKRVARAAGRNERDARRLQYEIQHAEQAIRDCDWQIDRLEGRLGQFDKYMEDRKKDRVAIGEQYSELHAAWDTFVVERQQKNDPSFNTKTRAKLTRWQREIDRASSARRSIRDAQLKAILAERGSAAKLRSPA